MELNNQDIVNATGGLLIDKLNGMTDPGAKITTALSVSFNSVAVAAAMLMGKKFDAEAKKLPNNDTMLLTLFLMTAAGSINSSGGVSVEFSPYRLLEALEDFKRFTGHDGEHLLDDNLMAATKPFAKVDRDSFGANSKFLPQ